MASAPTPWWVNEQLYTYVHRREAMPDVERLQTLYIKHGGSDQQGLATVVASSWEPLGRNASMGMPHRVSMRIAEAPAEFCMPVKQDRRLSPSFKVRMDVTLPQDISLPIFVKAQLITQQQKDNLTTTVPEEAAGGLGEDKNTKTFTELKGSTHQRHVFESAMGLSTLASEQRASHSQSVLQASSGYSNASPSSALDHVATLNLGLPGSNQPPAYSPFNMAALPPQQFGQTGYNHQLSGQMGPPPPQGPSSSTPAGVQGWVAPSWPNQARPSNDGSTAGGPANPGSLDRMILDAAGPDVMMQASQGRQPTDQPPQPPAPTRLDTPLTTISHDFEFVNLELLKPTRMNQVYMMFMCNLDSDILMLLYHVPTIGICRAEQRLKACAKLGVPIHWLNGPEGAIPSAPSVGQGGMYKSDSGMNGSSGRLHKLDASVLGGGGASGAAGLYMIGNGIGDRTGSVREYNETAAAEAAAGAVRSKRMACEQLMMPQGREGMHMDSMLGRSSLGVPVPPAAHHMDSLHQQWMLPSPTGAANTGGHRQSNDGQGSLGVPSLSQLLGQHGGQQGRPSLGLGGGMRGSMTMGAGQNTGLSGGGNSQGRPSLNQYNLGNSTGLPGVLPDGSLCVPGLKLLSGGSGNYSAQLSPANMGMGGSGSNAFLSNGIGGNGFLTNGMGMGGAGNSGMFTGQPGVGNSGNNSSGQLPNSISTPTMGGPGTGGGNSGQLAGRAQSHGVVTGELGGGNGNSGGLPRPSSGMMDATGRDGGGTLPMGGTGNSGQLAMHSLGGGAAGGHGTMTQDGLMELGDLTTQMGPPGRAGGLASPRASSEHLSAGGANGRAIGSMGPPRPLLNGGGSGGSAHFASLVGGNNSLMGAGGGGGGSILGNGGGSGGAAHFAAMIGGGGNSGPIMGGGPGGSEATNNGMGIMTGGTGLGRLSDSSGGGMRGDGSQQRTASGLAMGLLAEDTLMPSSSPLGMSVPPLSWQAMRDWIQDEYEAAAFSRKLTGQDMQALLSQAGFPLDAATPIEHVIISEQQGREFQQQFLTTVQLLRQVANLWNMQDPCVVAGFDMDRNGAVQALAAQPPGTFICRFSMSQPGALVLSCKTQASGAPGQSDSLLHAIIQIQDLYERRVDIWIRDFRGATHCLDVYRGKRVDKRKVFASDYTRITPGLLDTSSHPQVPVPPEHQMLQQH